MSVLSICKVPLNKLKSQHPPLQKRAGVGERDACQDCVKVGIERPILSAYLSADDSPGMILYS